MIPQVLPTIRLHCQNSETALLYLLERCSFHVSLLSSITPTCFTWSVLTSSLPNNLTGLHPRIDLLSVKRTHLCLCRIYARDTHQDKGTNARKMGQNENIMPPCSTKNKTRRWHVTISCQPDGRPLQSVRPWKNGRAHLAEGSNVVVLELPYSTEFGRGRAAI